jgi:hypothetical protein
MSDIQPIETLYKGYRFRSRLEARYAVFFDSLGLEYRYEEEGFELPDGIRYLPDFWFPQLNCWVEIKGQDPTEEEHAKCLAVAQSGRRIYLFAGGIPYFQEGGDFGPPHSSLWGYRYGRWLDPVHDWGYSKTAAWTECVFCGMIDIMSSGNAKDLSCQCIKQYLDYPKLFDVLLERHCKKSNAFFDEYFSGKLMALTAWYDTPRIVAAYRSARQARFEHGEKGI